MFKADTESMMTKYQLVFVRLENSFAKIFNSNRLRWLHTKQEAFYKIKNTAEKNSYSLNFMTNKLEMQL